MTALLDRDWIVAHLPHTGRMCLLEEVLDCNEHTIIVAATTHLAPDNPLRAGGRLGIACAIEYAAQTVALHHPAQRAMRAPDGHDHAAAGGVLVTVRDVRLLAPRLDDAAWERIVISCHVLQAGALALAYRFEVHGGDRLLAEGRLTIAVTEAATGARQ